MKILLFLSLFILFLNGENNKAPKQMTVEDKTSNIKPKFVNDVTSSNDFIIAKAFFSQGNYEVSYKKFHALFLKNSDNLMINYYLGISASKLKKYDEATAAFERALIKKDDFHRARLELAMALYRAGLKTEAKQHFKIVLAQPIPKNIRDNIERFLKGYESDKDKKLFLKLIIALNSNDNITNGNTGNEFYIKNDIGPFTNPDEEKDTSHTEIIDLTYKHTINDSFSMNHKFVGLNKSQTDFDDYDLTLLSYKPTLYYSTTENKRAFQIGIDKITTGDENNFQALLFAYTYETFSSKNFRYGYGLSYQDFSFDDKSNEDKNYSKSSLKYFFNLFRFSYLGSIDLDIKDNGDRTDINKVISNNTFMFGHKIYKEALNFQYNFRFKQFLDENKSFDNFRQDIYHKLQFNISHYFNKYNTLGFNISHIENESNQDIYTYKKNLISINYMRRFAW